ncbi:hypothetical protein T492DRAFT_1146734, partial [Pavlovales sp. CCMP2436]
MAEENGPWARLPIELQLVFLAHLRAADFASLEPLRAFPPSTLRAAIGAAAEARHPLVPLPAPLGAHSLAFAEGVEAMISRMLELRRAAEIALGAAAAAAPSADLVAASEDEGDETGGGYAVTSQFELADAFSAAIHRSLDPMPRGDNAGFGLGGESPRLCAVTNALDQLAKLLRPLPTPPPAAASTRAKRNVSGGLRLESAVSAGTSAAAGPSSLLEADRFEELHSEAQDEGVVGGGAIGDFDVFDEIGEIEEGGDEHASVRARLARSWEVSRENNAHATAQIGGDAELLVPQPEHPLPLQLAAMVVAICARAPCRRTAFDGASVLKLIVCAHESNFAYVAQVKLNFPNIP